MNETNLLNKIVVTPKAKRFGKEAGWNLLVLMVSIIWLLPLCWILSTSMRQVKNSFDLPPAFLPERLDFINYYHVFKVVPMGKFALNSMFIAVNSTVGMILLSSMAAYAFAKIDFKGKNVLFAILLLGMMIPQSSIIVPEFIIVKGIGLMDNPWSLILMGFYFPLALFMLRQFMLTIPKSYSEAAHIDGAGRMWILLRIIMPMSKPIIMVAAIMGFVFQWNNFLTPLIFLNSIEKLTLPLGMLFLKTTFGNQNMPQILAGVILTLIVPLIIYIMGQRYLVQGIMTSGLKS